MKKIVGLMKSVFSHHSEETNAKNQAKINFWCPTGMIPVFYDFHNYVSPDLRTFDATFKENY